MHANNIHLHSSQTTFTYFKSLQEGSHSGRKKITELELAIYSHKANTFARLLKKILGFLKLLAALDLYAEMVQGRYILMFYRCMYVYVRMYVYRVQNFAIGCALIRLDGHYNHGYW